MITDFTNCGESAVSAPVPLLTQEALTLSLLGMQIPNWPGPWTTGRQSVFWIGDSKGLVIGNAGLA